MKRILLAAAALQPILLVASCDLTNPPSYEDMSPSFRSNKEIYITSAVLEGGFQYYEEEGAPSIYFMIGKDASTVETSGKRVEAEIFNTSKLMNAPKPLVDVSVRGRFENLEPGTDYYCVLVKSVGGSKWASKPEKFTTLDIRFTVNTEDVTDLSSSSATLNGSAKFTGSDAPKCYPNVTFVVANSASDVEEVLSMARKNGEIPFHEDHPGEMRQGHMLPDEQGTYVPGDSKLSCSPMKTEYSTTYYYAVIVTVMDVVVCGDVKSFTTPFIEGAVDLGLSVYWADCNLGASSPEEYGDYYAWGETETKEEFNFKNYKWVTIGFNPEADGGFDVELTKYKGDWGSEDYYLEDRVDYPYAHLFVHFIKNYKYYFYPQGEGDGLYDLSKEDDAASVVLGGKWRMPSQDEWKELLNQCDWTLTTRDNVKGYEITSKINGNSIFLPLPGYISYSITDWDIDLGFSFDKRIINDDIGRYWSSGLTKRRFKQSYVDLNGETKSKEIEDPVFPDYLIASKNGKSFIDDGGYFRWDGLSIRPVNSSTSKEE